MATEEELIIRARMKGATETRRETRKVAKGLDEVGDEAEQAAAKIARLNAASGSTRVNLGPFSTSLRGGVLAVGALTLGVEKLTPAVLSAGEAAATLGGGGAGAGAVGFLAVAQGAGVARLAVSGLSDALGGNEEAMRGLSPAAYDLFRTVADARDELKQTASGAMMPGLTAGSAAAMRNFKVIRGIVRDTGREQGRLAAQGGAMLGSAEWGRDVQTLGRSNVAIMGDLGDAGLHLADAARHILVEAAPLAEWLAENAKQGGAAAEAWAQQARAGGDLRRFFADARTDMRLFGDATGDVAQGLGNLFGANDVSGTDLLRNLEAVTQSFEDWTNSPAVQRDFGAAITTAVADGVAAAAGAAANTLPKAAGQAAETFWHAFWGASPEAKGLIALLTGAKIRGAIQGSNPWTPLFVSDVTGGGMPGGKGKGRGPTIIPPWLGKWGPRVLGRVGLPAAVGFGAWQFLENAEGETVPSGAGQGGARHEIERTNRPVRRSGPFERVPDPGEVGRGNPNPLSPGDAFRSPFEPIVELKNVINLNGEPIYRDVTRRQARRDARRG